MAGSDILVLGGTGPAGICLLRELLYRKHTTIVYARTPSKIPGDLLGNPLLQVVKGELDDKEALSSAVSQSSAIISLLGPNDFGMKDPRYFADIYSSNVFPLMREHSVRRIFAMGTLSISDPEDKSSWIQWFMVLFVRILASVAYRNILNIADVFRMEAAGLDWTVYRIAVITGESDEESWKKDREDGETFVGAIGDDGWSYKQKRAALTRWLVDAVEEGAKEWIGKMPAVSSYAGGKKKLS